MQCSAEGQCVPVRRRDVSCQCVCSRHDVDTVVMMVMVMVMMAMCVVCVEAGQGSVDVSVDGPSANDAVKASISQQSGDLWRVEYTPVVAGPHTVNVYFAGQPVNHSPFTTHVKPGRSRCHVIVVDSPCVHIASVSRDVTLCQTSTTLHRYLMIN